MEKVTEERWGCCHSENTGALSSMVLDSNSEEENSWLCTERAGDILGRRTSGDSVGTEELGVIGNSRLMWLEQRGRGEEWEMKGG